MDFEEVFANHVDDVLRYVRSLCDDPDLAEDITSETFMKAIRFSEGFRGDSSVSTWLCQIAKNTYLTWAKRHHHTTPLEEDTPSEDQTEQKVLSKQQWLDIHHILHTLGEPHKEVFSLRVFSELSFTEIGAIFEKTPTWARVTFHRAKNSIKDKLEGSNDHG
ncbi:MAG: RNA polymerase sigma factor [Propionibacteriaceae bacterium]|nr:RNA polymerase sigma factor [Propionibacteriaceae bacterium]